MGTRRLARPRPPARATRAPPPRLARGRDSTPPPPRAQPLSRAPPPAPPPARLRAAAPQSGAPASRWGAVTGERGKPGSRPSNPQFIIPPLNLDVKGQKMGEGAYHVLVNFTVLGFSHDEDGAGGGMGDRAGDLVEKEI